MENANVSVEKEYNQYKVRSKSDCTKMGNERIGKPVKPKYSGNRSYRFDDLVNLFENMSTSKSPDDDSVFTEQVATSPLKTTLKNEEQNLDVSTNTPPPLVNSLHDNISDYFKRSNSCELRGEILSNIHGENHAESSPKINSSYKLTHLRHSIKRVFNMPKTISTTDNSNNNDSPLNFAPKEQRKLAVKETLKLCLQGLKSPPKQQISHCDEIVGDIFCDTNKETYNVCGVAFDVYKFNTDNEDANRKVIITLHDIAHNSKSNFEQLFSDLKFIDNIKAENISIYHITLPGHSTKRCPRISGYPGFAELSKMITILVTDQFKVESCIAIGVGAGADLLMRSSLLAPSLYSHLVCVNAKLRSIDRVKVIKYPIIFHPFKSSLTNYGVDYFESNCIKQFCASTVNIGSLCRYKNFLKHFKQNTNLSQLTYKYWKRPDIDYYDEQVFRRLESIPKILIKPKVLLLEGIVNPDKNSKGDILDFIYPEQRIYRSFDNGSKLVLEEYAAQCAKVIIKFMNDKLY